MHMKTHFSSISSYRDLSLCESFRWTTLIAMSQRFLPQSLYLLKSSTLALFIAMEMLFIETAGQPRRNHQPADYRSFQVEENRGENRTCDED